jgi:hypothetical protein
MAFAVIYVTSRIELSLTHSLKGLDRVGGLSNTNIRHREKKFWRPINYRVDRAAGSWHEKTPQLLAEGLLLLLGRDLFLLIPATH